MALEAVHAAPPQTPASDPGPITVFLAGDVMTGRGVDQVLAHPSPGRIYEGYVKDAGDYVRLAERAHGPIPKPVDDAYIWGDALRVLEQFRPDARIINLETAVTTSEQYRHGKGIHYRMHPGNAGCLTAAGIDCCVLANNHVLDWGHPGLLETLDTLTAAGLGTAGAGRNLREAERPSVLAVEGRGRVLVFSLGSPTSGIPRDWAASEERAGVNLLERLSPDAVRHVAAVVERFEQPGDVVVASIHWGSNWGYDVPGRQRKFAHGLIDKAGVDIVHGHSSHHPRPLEVYRERLILYGCGDLLTDYEGISGHEAYRGDLGLMYFVTVDPSTGRLARLQMVATQMRRFRLNRAGPEDARWLADVLNEEGKDFGTRVEMNDDGTLMLGWGGDR